MMCNMCGKDTRLVKAIIEGTEMDVCKECAKFGKIVKRVKLVSKPKKKKEEIPEVMKRVVSDYAARIKNAREKEGLKQEELAKKLNEKESIISLIEKGKFAPSLKLAEKLEKFFHIKLIEEVEEKSSDKEKLKAAGFTIGDIIKVKK